MTDVEQPPSDSSSEAEQPSRRQLRQAQKRDQQEAQRGKKKGKNAGKQAEAAKTEHDDGDTAKCGGAEGGGRAQDPGRNTQTDSAWEHDKQPPITGPSPVVYCGVCGGPPDFCEFGSQWPECEAWIAKNHAELLPFCCPAGASQGAENGDKTAAADELAECMQQLTVDGDAEKDAKKGGKKKAAKPNVVTIQRQSRSKRKTATVITGLDLFGVKLDKAAKLFSKQYACGASVSKGVPGQPQQVEVQGDVEEEVAELIQETFEIPEESIQLLPPK
ncbi:Translation initiation factor SUI1 family protein, related [Neospora caninum Liverpool]|uniref:Translation initiation factor SUI1 family protein, related n=1 Tax=Neospora caninum (strain Liverpool) TaxID=572307 RepID=F0VHK7_NEOCL|nr:Translation initiation factor SUI1 family protein, related [Neospora caninum Liverpool]CBZ53201.1 Translation initiation factor SUI1 family protein, related [Neospora caninum Liverpool]CEL67191.1 TPA: Translation initiation factor SUI1 family protein, related [Neospora caninum Liverpool]|eukprot:XP_003883233.1 Translation initiation factor SUI1 family protein, related [Neospora caninum Liverpool]